MPSKQWAAPSASFPLSVRLHVATTAEKITLLALKEDINMSGFGPIEKTQDSGMQVSQNALGGQAPQAAASVEHMCHGGTGAGAGGGADGRGPDSDKAAALMSHWADAGGAGRGAASSPNPGVSKATEAVNATKATDAQPQSAAGHVVILLFKEMLGMPVTPQEKHQAFLSVNELSDKDFADLMTALRNAGLLEPFLKTIGTDNAKSTVDSMDVKFPVPAVAFTGSSKDAVTKHYELGNSIFKSYNMTITQPSFTPVGNTDKEKKAGKDEKSLIGNEAGTFKEADLDADGGALDKVISSFLNPGMITSFWFSDLVEDTTTYGSGRQLHGQAVREKSAAKHKGKEAVFMDVNAAGHVFAHELGHILGGKGEEAEHAKGADGKPGSGDQENVMFQHVLSGKNQTKLTPQQVQAFKSSIYARIAKVKLIGDFPPVTKPGMGLA